jgi:hypothetical protein
MFFEQLKAAGVKTEATFPAEGNHGGPEMYTEENLQKMVHFLNCVREKGACCSKEKKCCDKEKGCCKKDKECSKKEKECRHKEKKCSKKEAI